MKMTVPEFATLIDYLCITHRASVTSWIRSPKRNHDVGGLANSLHLTGLAVDVKCDDPATTKILATAARRAGLDAVEEDDHLHLEADPNSPPPKL
jgi:uncharacterized protein YcbK (DUF882 family)